MQKKSTKQDNTPVLSPKQQLAIITPRLEKINRFIHLSLKGQVELRLKEFGEFTLQRVVNNIDNQLPISQINKLAPDECAKILKNTFIAWNLEMNYERNLTGGNIDELVIYIRKNYYFYGVDDVFTMLQMLKMGQLTGDDGKVLEFYGAVTIALIYKAIKAYEKRRHELIMLQQETKHQPSALRFAPPKTKTQKELHHESKVREFTKKITNDMQKQQKKGGKKK